METRHLPGSTDAGREYLQAQTIDQRRASGRVYTPPHIVQFVLQQAGYTADADVENRPLLDPACGAGAFLEQAVQILFNRLQNLGLAAYDKLTKAVESNLWGTDSDNVACEIATEVVRNQIETLTGRRPPDGFFRANVFTTDFLLASVVEQIPPVASGRIALIVGNPPYVSATRIGTTYKKELRKKFHAAEGRIDLYAMFIERALALLPPGGRLALITPDKFLTSYSARRLRSIILSTSAVRSIARFGSHSIFKDAAIVPCITVLERSGEQGRIRIQACGYQADRDKVQVLEDRQIEPAALGSSAWRLQSATISRFIAKLRGAHPTLKDIALRISAGPATGRDSLFVLPDEIASELEPNLLRPAVRGRDIDAYQIADSGLTVLLPYEFDGAGSPQLVKLSSYPKAARYLRQYRDELSTRHCVRVWGKDWYDFHDQPALDLAKHRKILVPDVANSNRFAVDAGKYFPLHSAYYILPKPGVDVDYVVAVLNSTVASFLIRIEAPVVKDGFNRYRQQFLMTLPIPTAPSSVAQAIVRAAARRDLDGVDALIASLFGLTPKETSLVADRLSGRLAA